MKCKISVIIPVYNTEEYILRCLNSIVSQTFKDYEIIIIDDGSKDKSSDIIKEFIKSHQDIAVNYIYQENAGQAAARNLGIYKAQGEYICFIDSDDYIEPDMLEVLYSQAAVSNADIVVCNIKMVYEDGIYNTISHFSNWSDNSIKNYILSNAGPCAKIIKTRIIEDNNLHFLQGIIYEDLAVVPAYGLYANKIEHVEKALYDYFQRNNSTMNQPKYNKKFEHIFISLENLTNIFKNENAYDKYIDEIEYLYIEHLLHAACLRFLPFKEGEKNIDRIIEIMKNNWPHFSKNKYFKKCSIKYRIICNLFYKKRLKLLKKLLKV